MRKPTYPLAVLAVASVVSVTPFCAIAQQQQNQHEQSQHQQPPRRATQNPPTGVARPGLVQPVPQGPRNAVALPPGRGPVPQAGHWAHGPLPSRNFGGHVYRGHLAWDRGHWRHEWHNGRLGWWWDVDGAWYFYPQPMDGPPAYVSDVEAVDEAPVGAVEAPEAVGEAYPPPAAPVEGGYPPPPPPQEAIGGAVGGAILGGLIGGAVTGRAGGAVAGALVGGTTGALIGAEAERPRGYYWWRGNCYYRYPSGEYAMVGPRYCS
jgi:Glycine zipper